MSKYEEYRNRTSHTKILEEVKRLNNKSEGGSKNDDRFWQPSVDDAGNGYAVIRFLDTPPADIDDGGFPFVRVFRHAFQHKGSWYIENSLSTIGQPDPVVDLNRELWNSGFEEHKDQARAQKRKLTYISNILVVSDKANPENNGKVFLFKYGKKIWDKIAMAMEPEFDDEAPIPVFDLLEGANFKLKIRNVEGYRNYDLSAFDAPSAVENPDEVMAQTHSLKQFVAPDQFKSYDELKRRLDQVLGKAENKPQIERTMPEVPKATTNDLPFDLDDDDDDALESFRKLAG